ncbi:alpha/beta fold hydrolase [Paucibacter sp. PLA-PC-4]|uniref:bifunctional 4-carboxymuconolactone decarboxylase/3-oxoadipate enol-lactonase PcaCD n=1 Tax=Paucibacter sp. PLA-PC-4 TaxID=2993655 RepID=UPI002248AC9C|nr:alpha/beta fold hydrolase [Paucibacter sp. PLA-PC-4]MCX2861150.1 alpha/beta fold hydrolase [Paucibacter sp. PLA-PC-4]
MTDSPDSPDQRDDDFDRGLVNRRQVLGEDWVRRSTAGATAFNADFQEFITRYAWHEIWGRTGLDKPTRRLLVLGMTMGLARWEEFELHCRAAVRASKTGGGVSLTMIQETLLQGAIYCGVPAANTAFKITSEILKAEGLGPLPAPLTRALRPRAQHTFSQPQLHLLLQGEGSGVPIVFAHALGLDAHLWDGLAAALGGQHPTLRYDQRGHGESARPAGPYSLDELVDDAARLIREWGRGPVCFVGLSLGGMVGQGLALKHPELLRGLVLAHTTAQYPEAARAAWAQRIAAVEAGGMAAVAGMVTERYLHADFRAAEPEAAAFLHGRLLAQDPAAYIAACQAVRRVDYLGALSGVRCPTLVIAGALDQGATPAMAEAIAQRIPGARLEVLAGASHLSPLEQPEALLGLLGSFAAGL